MVTENQPSVQPPTFLSLNHLSFLFFSFDGKIGRQKYCLGLLSLFIFSFITNILLAILPVFPPIPVLSTLIKTVLWFGVFLTVLIGSFAVIIKRLHDLNQSGWWALLMLVPLLNVLMAIYLALVPSHR